MTKRASKIRGVYLLICSDMSTLQTILCILGKNKIFSKCHNYIEWFLALLEKKKHINFFTAAVPCEELENKLKQERTLNEDISVVMYGWWQLTNVMNFQVMQTLIFKNEVIRIWIVTKDKKMYITDWQFSKMESEDVSESTNFISLYVYRQWR